MRDLDRRILDHADEIADAALAAGLEKVPILRTLTEAERHRYIGVPVRQSLETLLRPGAGDPPDPESYDAFAASCLFFADRRLPLEDYLEKGEVIGFAVQQALWQLCGLDERAELRELLHRLDRASAALTQHLRRLYTTGSSGTRLRTPQERVVEGLLAGEPVQDLAGAHGIRLGAGYFVLVSREPLSGPGDLGAPACTAPCRRAGALVLRRAAERVHLLPRPEGAAADRNWRPTPDAVDLVERHGRLPSGYATAVDLAAVPAAYEQARVLADIAAARPESPPGPLGPADGAVELALLRDPAARGDLLALLDTLSAGPDLPLTLETLFRHRLDRTAAAAALHVHRRTLAYRVARIRALTGADLGAADGIQRLHAAVVLLRWTAATGGDRPGDGS